MRDDLGEDDRDEDGGRGGGPGHFEFGGAAAVAGVVVEVAVVVAVAHEADVGDAAVEPLARAGRVGSVAAAVRRLARGPRRRGLTVR